MKVKVISLPYIFQVLFVLCFTRSRYQVSVYRTNGPLVNIYFLYFLAKNIYFAPKCSGQPAKMAAIVIYGRNLSKIFCTGTSWPISTKTWSVASETLPIIVCSNDDPGVTLTYFTARSNLVIQAFLLENGTSSPKGVAHLTASH